MSGCGVSGNHGYNDDFISRALLARLNDDDPQVVHATLELGIQVMYTVILNCMHVFCDE